MIYFIHNFPLSHTLTNNIESEFMKLDSFPIFKYPWNGLEQIIESKFNSQFILVGYGSLLNKYSSIETLSFDSDTFKPVISFGIKRVYNYKAPDNIIHKYNSMNNPQCIGCLNVVNTNKMSDAINGLTFRLKVNEVKSLRKREQGYDLIPVVTINWENPANLVRICYVLSAPNEPRLGKIWVDGNIYPIPEYETLCQEGARSISSEFLEFFHKSTYLADEKTLAVNNINK